MPTRKHMAGGGAAQATNVFKEAVKRTAGLIELGANAIGVLPYKQLRVRVVILRDEQGRPLCAVEDVRGSWEEAARIFSQQAHVRLIAVPPSVTVVAAPSPVSALNVHCDDGAWQEDFDSAGDYFRRHCLRTTSGRWMGYAAPVTVFIVRNISNKGGCSLGPLSDYVTLEAGMLNRARYRLLAHEVAHACSLWHVKDKNNLMFPVGPGDRLARWQVAVLRSSRHVTMI